MLGRATASAELERDLGTTPFETYNLYRGQKFGGDEGEGGYRVVGKFKVTIPFRRGDPLCHSWEAAFSRHGALSLDQPGCSTARFGCYDGRSFLGNRADGARNQMAGT